MARDLYWAKCYFESLGPEYTMYDEYYDGKHTVLMSDEMLSTSFGQMLKATKDNLCPVVVDTIVDRMKLLGFTSPDKDVKKFMADMWKRQRMASRAISVHHKCKLYGDAYLMIWPASNGKVALYPQNYGTVVVKYDYSEEEPRIVEAVKAWVEDVWDPVMNFRQKRLRVTIYTETMIYRYYRDTSNEATDWSNFPSDTSSLMPFGDEPEIPNKYGRVPVFRFYNGREENKLAMSEIRDVIPMQDVINKTLKDLMMCSEFQGFKQRWLTGVDIPKDPATNKPIEPFEASMKRMWAISGTEAKFGEFTAGDLTQIIGFLDNCRHEVARISRTPAHLFLLNTGDFPSGEALRTAEAPLLSKASASQAFIGDVWEDAMKFAYFVETGIDVGDLEVTSTWQGSMQYTQKEYVDTLAVMRTFGLSEREALRLLDYTDEQIDEMLKENDEREAIKAEQTANAFGRGLNVNPKSTNQTSQTGK